ncbi:CDP-glucose 4,6-dehydratase [Sphingomonas sp. PR090111-T3T-6A]|uniref:CDP-glucose 4,6-dehydratase n=1 Tax=Sphingomonas sp. PR090111-T3T-6A TaxID=685778 RepID=UPI0003679B1B|nr:CDP-glucose 4,6-dehydratase [Sphingomonas sp. PR090111-T3T-6A]
MPELPGEDDGLAEALAGRKVLVTGHSGFKGGWLCLWLERMGARVVGISLPPPTTPSFYEAVGLDRLIDSRFADIRDPEALGRVANGVDAELVFHLAAQPIVRRSHRLPAETFATNVTGTANVLDLARAMPSLRAVVVVTSDKCYDNRGWSWPYRETDRLGGTDPYSASKACTELVAECYRRLWFADPEGPQLATARAGNVIGGGDWAEDRLVPDIVRAASNHLPLFIRNPRSIRPWQHVLEPLSGYLLLAARLLSNGRASFSGAWNFGPSSEQTVDVETLARAIMACSRELDLPIRFGAEIDAPHEASVLKLDSSKAHAELGWSPRLTVEQTLSLTAEWYAAYLRGEPDMREISRAQLAGYRGLRSSTGREGLRRCA